MAEKLTRTIDFRQLSPTIQQLSKQLNGLGKDLLDDVEDILIEGAKDIRQIAIASMRNTKKTIIGVKRGNKLHYASLPQYPPAIDTGQLIRSITFDARHFEAEVGATTGAPYAKFLEEGTDKMGRRPWLTPAAEQQQSFILNKILRRIEDI